jgi:hypothetical protein
MGIFFNKFPRQIVAKNLLFKKMCCQNKKLHIQRLFKKKQKHQNLARRVDLLTDITEEKKRYKNNHYIS